MSTINAQTIINEVMAAHAVAPEEATSFISFRTSAKGLHRIRDCKENLQRFADMVRKNAAAFGGGLIREAKQKPAISWPANLISLFKQSIEDHDYQAALDIGDKLGSLFFVDNKGQAQMQVAPVPCEFEPRLSSVCNENGTYAVIFPQNMTSLSGASVKAKRSRNAQIDNVQTALSARTEFNLSEALDKQSYSPVDQVASRAQWIVEHGLCAEVIESRIVAHEIESIEAMATQDVAQVVAQAVATIAISEAMQGSETGELVTCEAGESEAHAVTVGSATWAPVPQYVPCPPDKTGFNDGPAPAFRGDDGGTDTPPPAEFLGDATPPVAISSASFAGDIPLSLAVSAYNGVSMSPERRGQSAKSEYAATMASDYETMHAQAVKGGTLDLLPEVFARYRARQSSAYKAYLSSSSRCVSSFIAGPSNFPAARMNKRSDIAHKRLGEYLNGGEMALRAACRTLRPDLRAIMAGDVDAIDRLTVDISSAERTQDQMKAANKAIRANAKAGEAHQVAALMELGHSEAQALELLHPRFSRGQGFPSFSLTNNQANIRRMRARLEQITAAKARPVETVECANGVTLEDDAPSNRVRLFFPGKPSEEIRADLKSSGFRWAPSVGAWQAYRNRGTLETARRMAGEVLEQPPVSPDENQGGMGGLPVQNENDVMAVEATPPVAASIPPVAGSKPNSEGERIRAAADKVRDQFPAIAAKYDDLAHSHDLKDEREARTGVNELSEQNLINAGVHPITAEIVERDGLSGFGAMAQAEILAKLESAKQTQDAPQTTHASDSHGWEPAIGERYIGAVEYAVQEANKRGDGFEYRTGEDALMERRKNTAPTLRGEWLAATQANRIESKSGKWTAWTFTTVIGAFGLGFMQWDNFVDLSDYMTAKDRMKALQGMARAVDEFTPPGGGLPCPEPVAVVEPVASVEPTPPPAVSSASPAPRVAVRRNFIPDNGLHIVEDSFEAWTFPSGARFAFVMYLGKSAKPWKYYGYSTKAKRDDGFNRHAQEARSIALSKANRKAESKAQAEKPHGLQVGDVVRSSWGYDQTNVDHYQIVKVIGKRTVEVRKLVEHKESTGDMTGRLAPVHGEFVGEVMRRQVDSLGQVNILQASYGRASKIEPLAIVHGVRCYAASSYSSYA